MARVLVVDDQPETRAEIARMLNERYSGLEIVETEGEAAGLAAIWNERWNLVVLNLASVRSEHRILFAAGLQRPAPPVLSYRPGRGPAAVSVCPTIA